MIVVMTERVGLKEPLHLSIILICEVIFLVSDGTKYDVFRNNVETLMALLI